MKSNFKERKENRLAAMKRLAAMNESKAERSYQRAKELGSVIPMGQPILVGHHSEGSHRAHLKKIDGSMRASVEADKKAAYYADRAHTIETSTAISSDDPTAIEKLEEKLAGLIRNQELMKACNKILKSAKLDEGQKKEKLMEMGLKETTAVEILKPVYGRVGIPSYKLTNNNATIAATKKRIAYLKDLEGKETSEEEIKGVRLVINREDNRVQIFFPSIPAEEVRKKLKGSGFHWAPSVGAWMRQISNHAVWLAKEILNGL